MTIRSISVMRLIAAGSIAAVLGACSTAQDIEELEAARAVVAQVESSPQASLAAVNVNEARNALQRANNAAEEGEDEVTVKHHAYIATRHAQIANEKILAAQAEEALRQGEAERARVMAQARTREAEIARQSAEQAQSRAQQARSEAQRLATEREELMRELQSMRDLNARQTERGTVLTLGDVLFDVDQATLKPGAMRTMDKLAEFLNKSNNRGVIIEGHTDSTGSDSHNMDLSRRRADAVRMALLERGVSDDQVRAIGKGESVPVASNDNPGGRQQNRRVEIIIPDEGRQSGRVAADSE